MHINPIGKYATHSADSGLQKENNQTDNLDYDFLCIIHIQINYNLK